MKLNLGCASQVVDGWINVDYALGARLAKLPLFGLLNRKMRLFNLNWSKKIYLHNLTKTFPWADRSIDIVYSSHTLEHFSKAEGRRVLAECHRVLRTNGIIRIVVPDLRHDVIEYIEGRTYAEDFVDKLGVLYGNSNCTLKRTLFPFIRFPHKCMYDSARLIEILNEIGFEASGKVAFDSDIEDIRLIELESRTDNAAIVEGKKR